LSNVLLLTSTGMSAAEILPSLSLLDHVVTVAPSPVSHPPAEAAAGRNGAQGALTAGRLADGWAADAVLVDARQDLVRVRQLFAALDGIDQPVLAIVTEGGWAAVTAGWAVADVILHTAGPGEVEARIRLAIGRGSGPPADRAGADRTGVRRAAASRTTAGRTTEVRSGELVIDEATYSARISGAALDLTFKEFELLKFLAQHPRRVFTRSQLLQEVWGYDYFGGTRTVDVHVRRLRAKLGAGNEALIGTVRNVGYKFEPAKAAAVRPGTGAKPRTAGPGQPAGSGTLDDPAPPGQGARRENMTHDLGVRR
jgi:DNA-binding response OmpR family regulator